MFECGQENDQKTSVESRTMPPLRGTEKGEAHLTAYQLDSEPLMRLVPASVSRSWMADTQEQFAKRCLPLLLANQAGWFVLNSHTLRVTWNGDDAISGLKIECISGSAPYPAKSHFGHGILTWHLPYLFRTSPGYNLLVRGPANWPKDGAFPLEGLVETDWSVATFTMNWKLTRPDLPVIFDRDEPICMLVPQRRGELETFQPQILGIKSEPEIEKGYCQWSQSRQQFLVELQVPGSEANKKAWQKDYFQGISPDPGHQFKLKLQSFHQNEDNF